MLEAPFRVFRRSSRKYYTAVFRSMPDLEFSTQKTTRDAATLWAENVMLGHISLNHVPRKDRILKHYAKNFFMKKGEGSYQWNCRMRELHYASSYFTNMQARLDNYILPYFGEMDMSELKTRDISKWFLSLKSTSNGKLLSASYRNKVLNTFKIITSEALMDEVITRDPLRDIKQIRESNDNRREAFSEKELEKMFPPSAEKRIEIWGSLQWAAYFSVAIDTGFRPGEITGLSKASLSRERKGLFTKESVSNGKICKRIKTTGTGLNFKAGLLSDTSFELITRLIEETEDKYLFKTVNGIFIGANTANKHLRAICSRIGIKLGNRTQYSFRHSFYTRLKAIAPNETCNELMGLTNTIANYDHRTPETILEQLRTAMNSIEKKN